MVNQNKPLEQIRQTADLDQELERLAHGNTQFADRRNGRSTTIVTTGEGVAFHPGDLRPPLLKLVQPTSADGTAGKFRRLDTDEELDDLRVTAIRVQPSRIKWPADGFSRDRVPECLSRDGIHAVTSFSDGSMPLFPGATCQECKFFTVAPWRATEGAEMCLPGYDITLMDTETYEVFGLRLQGTAAKVARVLGAKTHFRKAQVRLWGEKVVVDRGTWYQLRARAEGLLSDEAKAQAEMAAEEYGEFADMDS
jgi:hypothetical protein